MSEPYYRSLWQGAITILVVACGSGAHLQPQPTTLAKVSFATGAQTEVTTWVIRRRLADGNAQVVFHAEGLGPHPKEVTLVPLARDPHPLLDAELETITSKVVAFPDGQPVIRIDVQRTSGTVTTLIGFRGGELHRLLELPTGWSTSRSASCRAVSETSLRLSAPGRPVMIEAMTYETLRPVGSAPADAACTGPPRPVHRALFKLRGDELVEIQEEEDEDG